MECYAWDGAFTYTLLCLTKTPRPTIFGLLLSTWYLRDDRNNALSIFMLSGSMEILSSFHFKSKNAIFIKQCFVQLSMTNAVQYVYIYIYIYIFNKSITIYWSSQAMHFHMH